MESLLSTALDDRESRWTRARNPDRLILQPRDREIMVGIYSYRLLTSEQVQKLFHFNSLRRVNSRLRKLYDHHYLDRSFLTTVRGSGKALYSLGPEGAGEIARELGLDIKAVRRKRKGISQLKELYLNHSLDLNRVRIDLCRAIQSQPELKLERWINDNDCEQTYRVIQSGREITRRFRPDGYFRFWYGKRLDSFFLELDRSTMSLGRFQNKVQTYLEFERLGFYQRRFGLKRFEVLVIVPSASRLNNLKEAVEEITDQFFWFTTLEQTAEDKVLGQVWQRAGNKGLYPLIDAEST
jgi:hypothetical protein